LHALDRGKAKCRENGAFLPELGPAGAPEGLEFSTIDTMSAVRLCTADFPDLSAKTLPQIDIC
jgi:hypothetical protein